MSDKKKNEVSKNRVVKIFEALGFKTAGQWDAARLQKKLLKLNTLIEGAELDVRTQKRVDEILRAQNESQTVKVIDTEDVVDDKRREKEVNDGIKRKEDERKEKMAKKAKTDKKVKKATKKAKKTTKTTQKKKEATKKETDKFGSRKGSSMAEINAALSKKPKKMADLVKDAGATGTYYEHLKKLIKAGHVKKSDKGFSLA